MNIIPKTIKEYTAQKENDFYDLEIYISPAKLNSIRNKAVPCKI